MAETALLHEEDRYFNANGIRLHARTWNAAAIITSAVNGHYYGAKSERENYEEHCGLAMAIDLRRWTRLTTEQLAILAPHGTRSVRYMEVVLQGATLYCYYEYARADGAHELRRRVVSAEQVGARSLGTWDPRPGGEAFRVWRAPPPLRN